MISSKTASASTNQCTAKAYFVAASSTSNSSGSCRADAAGGVRAALSRANALAIREHARWRWQHERRRQSATDEDARRCVERAGLGSLPQATLGGYGRVLAWRSRTDPRSGRAPGGVGGVLQIDRKQA